MHRQMLGCVLGGMLLIGCQSKSLTEPIYLGHVLPRGTLGEEEYTGIAWAVDRINSEASQRPLGRRLVVVHAETGASDSELRAQAIRLAVVQRVVALLGGQDETQANALVAAATAEQNLALLLSQASSPSESALSLGLSLVSRVKILAKHWSQQPQPGAEAWCLVVDPERKASVAVGEALAQECRGAKRPLPQVIPWSKSVPPAERARSLAAAKPRALIVAGSLELLREVQGAGASLDGWPQVSLAFIGEEKASVEALRLIDPVLHGAVVTTYFADDANAAYREFRESYQTRWGKVPTHAACFGAEAVLLTAEVLRRAKSTMAKPLVETLTKADAKFPLLTGEVSFAADGSVRRGGFIHELRSGKVVRTVLVQP